MSLKRLLLVLFLLLFTFLLGLGIMTSHLFSNEQKLNARLDVQHRSLLLADELRHSSDDLTRLARTYVTTGNTKYEHQYWAVLDVRNGKIPRPVDYNLAYWDLYLEEGHQPRPAGETISLHDLMVREGFTSVELAKLTEAQNNSDILVKLERIAMNASKGLFDDGNGNFTVKKKPDRELAMRLLNDETYHKAKASIMKPINECAVLVDNRTSTEIHSIQQHSINLSRVIITLIFIVLGILIAAFVFIQRQITRRVEAEEALKESESQFRALFENASDGIIYLSSEAIITKTNMSFAKMHGYTVEEMNNMQLQALNVEDLSDTFPEKMKRIRDGENPRFEIEHLHKDGHIINLDVTTHLFKSKDENFIVAFHRDITESKHAEEMLKVYKQIFMSVNDVINVADLNDDIVLVNPAFCKTYGYSERELIGANSSIFWSDRNPKEVVQQIFSSTLKGGWKGELYNKRKDGTEFPVSLSTSVIKNDSGEAISVVGIAEDITERRRSELEQYAIFEITHGISTTGNLNELLKLIHLSLGKVLYAENFYVALYDKETDFFSYPYFVDKIDPCPEPEPVGRGCTAYIFRSGKSMLITPEIFRQLKEQNEVELVGSYSPSWIGIPLQTPARIIGVLVLQHYEKEDIYSQGDIQFLDSIGSQIALAIDRKQAEEGLRDSEIKLKGILQSTTDGILAVDSKGKVILSNKRFGKLWRIPQALIDSGDDEALIGFVLDQLSNADEFISNVHKLYLPMDKDLDYLYFRDGRIFERYSSPLVMDDSSIGRVWSFRDITAKRLAEDEIRKSNEELKKLNTEKDKFFSILAHDLRSPFNGFLGLTQVMSENLPAFTTDQLQKIAVMMRKSATNLYDLLGNLLDWSGMQRGLTSFTPTSLLLLSKISESIVLPLQAAANKDITFNIEIPDDLAVFADENMLNGIIRNLVNNAVKFTPKGGNICISAKPGIDDQIEISIKDSGIGMNQNMINNLFRLDENTSRKGTEGESSTGLGLIICKDFIEKHGGKLWVESIEGKGSTFYFTLPVK